ncbi:hypothetical protein LZV53_27710, partial [Klebsiella michiganensis]|uniref:hypothetical protein n=1 Tax=Klebsiella michiganensis TaxID=1134687 RepID=UPI001F1C11DE
SVYFSLLASVTPVMSGSFAHPGKLALIFSGTTAYRTGSTVRPLVVHNPWHAMFSSFLIKTENKKCLF